MVVHGQGWSTAKVHGPLDKGHMNSSMPSTSSCTPCWAPGIAVDKTAPCPHGALFYYECWGKQIHRGVR